MADHADAFEDDGVHAVDIIVKGRGTVRLTRLTDTGDIEAALTVLKDRSAQRRARAGTEGEDKSREGAADVTPSVSPG
jgi:hypothetical protein